MAFKDFVDQAQGIALLQRSLERGRLAHAYLFSGDQLDSLESLGRTLAKTLNCTNPVRRGSVAIDCCDRCVNCRKIEQYSHPDVHWTRPESKSRVIVIDQIRELMQQIYLKPSEAAYKVAVIVAADRLNPAAANAFLKTLEEPPANSIIVLLTTEPQRLLETILSRCLRLRFGGDTRAWDPAVNAWLQDFSRVAAAEQKSLLGRYRLMDLLLGRLNEMRERIETTLTERSPLQKFEEVEKNLEEKWEAELKAAIEAEYRRQRTDLLLAVQWWLRDIWLHTLEFKRKAASNAPGEKQLLSFPDLPQSRTIAERIDPRRAMDNLELVDELQEWLGTNVQEALAIEVGLLQLHL